MAIAHEEEITRQRLDHRGEIFGVGWEDCNFFCVCFYLVGPLRVSVFAKLMLVSSSYDKLSISAQS